MAIEGVTADVAANKDHAPWYSLAGDRAPNPHKGIYVKKRQEGCFQVTGSDQNENRILINN